MTDSNSVISTASNMPPENDQADKTSAAVAAIEFIEKDDSLAIDKFNVDEENPHIVLKDISAADMAEFRKLQLACPAALYRCDDDGTVHFDYAGCLECGTCRILCGQTILEKWEFPRGTFGVEYRYG